MNELFTIAPNLKQYYGRTVTKDMEFDEYTDDKSVHQTLKNLVLKTEIKKESEFEGIKSTEKSTLTQELPEGAILIWNEQQGYILPNVKVYKLKDLKEEIGLNTNQINSFNQLYQAENDIQQAKETFDEIKQTKHIYNLYYIYYLMSLLILFLVSYWDYLMVYNKKNL